MSALQTVPRLFVGTALTAAVWPLRAAARLLPGGGESGTGSASLAVEHLDAAARSAAGRLLGDERLREDARLRHDRASELGRSLRMRRQQAQAQAQAEQDEHQASVRAQKRRSAARSRARDRKERVEQQVREEQLAAVAQRADALDGEAEVLVAEDEARRLADAAAREKERRKRRNRSGGRPGGSSGPG